VSWRRVLRRRQNRNVGQTQFLKAGTIPGMEFPTLRKTRFLGFSNPPHIFCTIAVFYCWRGHRQILMVSNVAPQRVTGGETREWRRLFTEHVKLFLD